MVAPVIGGHRSFVVKTVDWSGEGLSRAHV